MVCQSDGVTDTGSGSVSGSDKVQSYFTNINSALVRHVSPNVGKGITSKKTTSKVSRYVILRFVPKCNTIN